MVVDPVPPLFGTDQLAHAIKQNKTQYNYRHALDGASYVIFFFVVDADVCVYHGVSRALLTA